MKLCDSDCDDDDADDDDNVEEVMDGGETPARGVPVSYETGRAGTGKTYNLLKDSAAPDSKIKLCASTGIAAVNLGTTTVNATLRYFDTASLRDAYLSGSLTRTMHDLALAYRWLAIDEGSMVEADQLDLIYRGAEEANKYKDVEEPFGIRLVGDFAQLPPVQGRWAFEADCWRHFSAKTTRLEKVWRQDGGPFLDALNYAREGRGGPAAETLESAMALSSSAGTSGAQECSTWNNSRDEEFDGTTILPKNQLVNRHNALVLARHPGKVIEVKSRRWGKQRSEWGENSRTHEWGIPPLTEFKIGAYVMILANAADFEYANGDCGHIEELVGGAFQIRLVRTGEVVSVPKIIRAVDDRSKPEGWHGLVVPKNEDFGGWRAEAHFRGQARRYVFGQVEYYPLRLAWASTVHKSQGLTLDRVQVDFRDRFFASPAMLYVALSRCRTLGGLRLVGMKDIFVRACQMDQRVRDYV